MFPLRSSSLLSPVALALALILFCFPLFVSPIRRARDACDGLAQVVPNIGDLSETFPASNPRQIRVGVAMTFSDYATRPQYYYGTELARKVLNSQYPFSNGNWTLITSYVNEDCAASDVNGLQQVITQSQPVAFFGPACSVAATPQNLLARYYDIPLLSPSATSSVFSDKAVYPYFNRVWNPQKTSVIAMLRLMKYFGWSHAVLITTSETFGSDFVSLFRRYGADAGITADVVIQYPLGGGATPGTIEPLLEPLKSTNVKVFVLWSFRFFDMKAVLDFAAANGLTGDGTAWLGTDEMWGTVKSSASPGQIVQYFHGFMTISRDLSVTQSKPEYAQFLQRFNASYPNVAPDLYGSLDSQTQYDGMYAIGLAIGNLISRGVSITDGAALNAELKRISFNGAYSNFALDSNGDPKDFPFAVQNLIRDPSNPNGYSFRLLGSILAASDYASSPSWTFPGAQRVTFPGRAVGDNYVPIDFSTVISVSHSVPIAILSFVCAALGSWCCLILVEQLVFDHRSFLAWLKSSKHSSSMPQKIRKIIPVMISLLTCSASLAFCALWSTVYINQYQLKFSGVPNIAAFFDPLMSLISVLPALFLVMVAFLVAVHSASVVISAESDKRRHENWNTGSEQEFSSLGSLTGSGHVSQVTAPSVGSAASANSGKASSKGSNGSTVVGPGDAARKIARHRKINLDSKVEVLMEVLIRFNWMTLVSALMLSAALLVVNVMEISALSVTSASISLDSGYLVGCAIVGFCLVTIAIQSYIYLLRYRAVAALVMAFAIWGSNQLLLNSISLTFSQGRSSSGWQESILLIIGVSIAAVSSLILLSLQFQRMKLSRNSLDLIVLDLRKENANLKKRIAAEKANVNQLDMLIKYRQFVDECNHAMRPCFRPAAAAFSLAQLQNSVPGCCTPSAAAIERYLQQRCEAAGVPFTGSPKPHEEGGFNKIPGSTAAENTELDTRDGGEGQTTNGNQLEFQDLFDSASPHFASLPNLLRHMKVSTDLYLDILRHPVALELFKDFTVTQRNTENVQFWCECERYKSNTTNRKLRLLMCESIARDFLLDGAPHQINLSAPVRSKVLDLLDSQPGELNIFDSAQEEIFLLMTSSVFPAFCNTPQFRAAIAIFASVKPPKGATASSVTQMSPEERERHLVGGPASPDGEKSHYSPGPPIPDLDD